MALQEHGIIINENEENIPVASQSESGLTVVFGTAPIHLIENPESAVNVPILCNDITEAKKKLGYSEKFELYTTCQSMKMNFLEEGVGPLVFVNVLDPVRHSKDFESKVLKVEKNQSVLTGMDGVLLDSLKIQMDGEDLKKDVDYILSRDDESVLITLIGEKADGTEKQISVSGKQLDPSKVTDLDVIGGYDEDTGKETGIQLVRQIYPVFGIQSGILIAPGFSHHKTVGHVLEAKCEGINGCFRAECILDIDTEHCRKAGDVAEEKANMGYSDKHAYLVWPMAKRDGLLIYGSAVAAATTMANDMANGNIPNVSPSNKEVKIDAAVLADGTEVRIDFEQTQAVNGAGVATFINADGWRLWGNYSAAYPEKNALNVKFWCIRRFFTWHGNNFIRNHLIKIDGVANRRLIDSICDEENLKSNGYVSSGVCAAVSIDFTEEDNTNETIAAGKYIFRQKIGVYGPAQTIINNLEYDLDSVRNSLIA